MCLYAFRSLFVITSLLTFCVSRVPIIPRTSKTLLSYSDIVLLIRNDVRITDHKGIAVYSYTVLFVEKSYFVQIRTNNFIKPSHIIIGRFGITATKPTFRHLVTSARFTHRWRLSLLNYSGSLWCLRYIKCLDFRVNELCLGECVLRYYFAQKIGEPTY